MASLEILRLLSRLDELYPYGVTKDRLKREFSKSISQWWSLKLLLGLRSIKEDEINTLIKLATKQKLIAVRDSIDPKIKAKAFYITTEGRLLLNQYAIRKWTTFGAIGIISLTFALVVENSGVLGANALLFFIVFYVIIYLLVAAWISLQPERGRKLFNDYKLVVSIKKQEKKR